MVSKQIWDKDINYSLKQISEIASENLSLEINDIQEIGEGFDNTVFLINQEVIFRIVRREVGLRFTKNELIAIPLLNGNLNLKIPRFIKTGLYLNKWIWVSYNLIKGKPLYYFDDAQELRKNSVKKIAEFLKGLHALDVEPFQRAGLADDWCGHMNLEKRIPYAENKIKELTSKNWIELNPQWLILIESVRSLKMTNITKVIHGDFKASHILFDNSAPSGVIDWGDVHLGHPASDLSIAFSMFDESCREEFFSFYGDVSEEVLMLSKFRALFHTLAILEYAQSTNQKELLTEARLGLKNNFGDS